MPKKRNFAILYLVTLSRMSTKLAFAEQLLLQTGEAPVVFCDPDQNLVKNTRKMTFRGRF